MMFCFGVLSMHILAYATFHRKDHTAIATQRTEKCNPHRIYAAAKEYLADDTNNEIHRCAFSVLNAAKEAASEWWKTLMHIDTPLDDRNHGRIVVFGDLHGQLEDFLHVLEKYGMPSNTNVYLFNGDISNRGNGTLEIWMTILAFKLADPNSVHINRGNHEDGYQHKNPTGFFEELKRKFADEFVDKLYADFHAICALLPLYTVIDREIFVVHGGLEFAHSPTLDELAQIERKVIVTDMPHGQHYLRSDPTSTAEAIQRKWYPKSHPGFDEPTVKSFLAKNRLRTILRAHRPREYLDVDNVKYPWPGFEGCFDDTVMTVFSASNCMEFATSNGAQPNFRNWGAVAIISNPAVISIYAYFCPGGRSACEEKMPLTPMNMLKKSGVKYHDTRETIEFARIDTSVIVTYITIFVGLVFCGIVFCTILYFLFC